MSEILLQWSRLSAGPMRLELRKSVDMSLHIGTRCVAMVKETKFFRKQADRAERMARSVTDTEISEGFLNVARAYRSQAQVLKAKKKAAKKHR
jgi:hypothetical protein